MGLAEMESDCGQVSPRKSCGSGGDPARILIVDDNELNRQLLGAMLRRLGYAFDVACDGREAVELFQSGRYALVLMDCQMPVLDGYAATRAIRDSEPSGRYTPIVGVTAFAGRYDRDRCLAAGMDEYMTKPVKLEVLRDVLHRCIAR